MKKNQVKAENPSTITYRSRNGEKDRKPSQSNIKIDAREETKQSVTYVSKNYQLDRSRTSIRESEKEIQNSNIPVTYMNSSRPNLVKRETENLTKRESTNIYGVKRSGAEYDRPKQ